MLRRIFSRLQALKLWHLLWISLVLSQVFTAIMNAIQGYLWWGRIDRDQIIIGAINALVVAFIVTIILMYLFGGIRERERTAEEEVRQAKEEWERTFNSMTDLVMIVDRDYRIVKINKAMADRLSMKPSEAPGTTCYERVHGLEQPPLYCPHRMAIVDGRQHSAEVHEAGLGGHFLITANPLFSEGGEMTGSVLVARDISAQRHSEQALRESEEKFRTLFDSARDGIFILELDGSFIDVNRTAHERLGYSKEELLAMPLSALNTAEFARLIPDRLKRMHETGSAVFESAHRKKDGTVMPVEVNGRIIDFGGKKVVLSVIRDITDRKRAEKALRDSERFLQTVIDSEPECISLLGADGSLLQMNSAGLSMVEADSLDQLKGQCVSNLVNEDYRDAFRRLSENVFKGTPGKLEFQVTGLKGRRLWLETHAVPLRNNDSEIVAQLGITRDITERKHAEAALQKATAEKDALIVNLQQALATIKTLHGILPICASCKKIRDDKGSWNQLEVYIKQHSEAEFSHGLCPDCAQKLYPGQFNKIKKE